MRPEQNGGHFADNFNRILWKGNYEILIQILLKFVPKGQTDKSASVR